MFDQALDESRKVIALGTKKGMESIEIYLSYSNIKQVMINGTNISTQRAKEELGAGIRVIHNSSEGFSYTNIITSKSLMKAAEEAFSVAKLSPKIDGIGLPEKRTFPKIESTYSKEIAELDASILTNDALDFITGYTSIDNRIAAILSSVSANINGVAIVNSNDIEVQEKSTNYQVDMLLVASEKDKSGGYVFDSIFSRKHDVDLNEFGEKLGKKAIDGLNQEQIQAFDGSVIFRQQAMSNPVAIVASLAASADMRQRGISFWKDKLADKVTDENFQFVDRPHNLEGGGGIRSFDSEGNPTEDIQIIQDGFLQTFLHNQRTANKENLKPTGNAYRSLGGQPDFTIKPDGILPNSPWILSGDMSEEEMIQDTKKGIVLHNYQGTLRQQNGIFSGVAKGAYLIENGEIVKPVTGVSISGNVFDILNNISGIGKEYHLASGWLTTPIMRFEGIKISTK
ncbi:MAG: TldD/PmbA family protein [Candidatus Heimdallarchaeota archaeon]|nr:TldD/PmbA family protein [Candidatus Heimdallarchaeota archaeon]